MKKLVAYITSSYPDKNFTIDLSLSLRDSGVDLIELGLPFSDPVADGVVIEKASRLSLKNGYKFDDVLDISKVVAKEIPTLFMGYFNSFYAKGLENSIKIAKELGIYGFIIPDLPYEEALIYNDLFTQNCIYNIRFIAPTHDKHRIDLISKNSKGFIYLISYMGITGSNKSQELKSLIKHIRKSSKTPIYVGFGVDESSAKSRVEGADGVIVGSAFIKILLDERLNFSEKMKMICSKASVIKDKINS